MLVGGEMISNSTEALRMPIAKTLILLVVASWEVSEAARFSGFNTKKEKRFSGLPHGKDSGALSDVLA